MLVGAYQLCSKIKDSSAFNKESNGGISLDPRPHFTQGSGPGIDCLRMR